MKTQRETIKTIRNSEDLIGVRINSSVNIPQQSRQGDVEPVEVSSRGIVYSIRGDTFTALQKLGGSETFVLMRYSFLGPDAPPIQGGVNLFLDPEAKSYHIYARR